MVIQIRLSDRVDHTSEQIASDSLGRSWCGFDPSVGDRELWQHNRGRWDLNEARIASETYATFVHDDRTVAAYKINGYERVSDPGPKATKIALIGEPLTSADPFYDLLVDQPAIHRGRNAINYVADPDTGVSSESVAGHRAFLLTWNPGNSDWADYHDCVLTTQEGHTVDGRWSTGSRRTGIRCGDRVFLLRQGTRGRGLIGSGEAVDFADPSGIDEIIYTDTHGDNTGATTNYVDVLWDRLVEPDDMLPTDQLQEEFPAQNWTPMASGTEIQPDVVVDLQARWSEHVGRTRPSGGGQGRLVDAARRKAIEGGSPGLAHGALPRRGMGGARHPLRRALRRCRHQRQTNVLSRSEGHAEQRRRCVADSWRGRARPTTPRKLCHRYLVRNAIHQRRERRPRGRRGAHHAVRPGHRHSNCAAIPLGPGRQ